MKYQPLYHFAVSVTTTLLSLTAITSNITLAADWPQWMGPQRDGVLQEEVPAAFPKGGLKVRWRVPGGSGYAGPAVVGGKVYHLDRIATGEKPKDGAWQGQERLRCLAEATGQEIWTRTWEVAYQIDYGSGPRATPTVADGLVYVLGAEGDLRCLDAASGKSKWEKNLPKSYQCKPPTWGYAAHPLLWNGLLITLAGGKGSACVALDPKTGEEKWKSLTAGQIGYAPPVLAHHHARTDAIVWTADAIHGIDPNTGKALWEIPWSIRFGVSIAQPRVVGDTVLISNYWPGSKLLRLKPDGGQPEVVWETERESERQTTHLNALMCSPMPIAGHVYGICSYGQLRCLDWDTGLRKWESLAPMGGQELRWGTAFLTQIQKSNRFLIFNEHGELISATLTPGGYEEHSRQRILEPNCIDLKERKLVWSHPAYANGACFARNDTELVCAAWR